MNGFVIVSGIVPSHFLDRFLKWRKKKPDEAYVFSEKEKDTILEKAKSEGWKQMPEYLVTATYDGEKDTTIITGKLTPAYPTQ
jgi:hypothetical protein